MRKDVEDECRAIEDFYLKDFFQVASLCGRKSVVEDDGVHVVGLTVSGELAGFAQSIKIPRTSVNIPIFYNAFNVGNQSNIPYVKVDCNVIDADTGPAAWMNSALVMYPD